jgi:type II secretory pathway pseudopilin PulG
MAEATLVIIILGVVAAMAMPAYERSMRSSKVNRAANVVANDLRNAFSLAVRERKPIRVQFTTSARTYTITDRASGTVLVRRDFGVNSAFGITALGSNRTFIDVFPNGLVNQSVQVTINAGTLQRRINMTRVGQIRVS